MKIEVKSEAIGHLLEEHRTISQILSAFERLLDSVETARAVERSELVPLVEHIGEFSSLRHEEKEESLLLPALERLGMTWDTGPLAYVRREHRQERYLLRSLRQSCLQTDEWDAEDRRHFVAIGHELVAFLRRHMRNEEDFLFPEADQRLSPEIDRELVTQFRALDGELDRMPDSMSLRARAMALLQRFGADEGAETVRPLGQDAAWHEPH
jgi:hemerythrin-like domain-containing protein